MDTETIKFIVVAVCGAATTIGLAYVAARWHITVQVPPAGTVTTTSTATTTTPNKDTVAPAPAPVAPAPVTPAPAPDVTYTDVTLEANNSKVPGVKP